MLRYLVKIARLAQCYAYDAWRFARWSNSLRVTPTERNLQSKIMMKYHVIEKGLSYTAYKPGFGVAKINELIDLIHSYLHTYGHSCKEVDGAADALRDYLERNRACGHRDASVEHRIESCLAMIASENVRQPSTTRVPGSQADAWKGFDFDAFFCARHSTREFADRPVPAEVVRQAIQTARKAPSVCNRQAWRVHLFADRNSVADVLRYQDGNSGFGHAVPVVALVTMDVEHFQGIRERNQGWIDGGLFSMGFVLALHAKGLVTCCLNMCISPETDQKLRRHVGFKASEAPVMMIAIGYPLADYLVPSSRRKDVDDILVVHG